MGTNTGLTKEKAALLLKQNELLCPNCGKTNLVPRYKHKNQNVEYKCTECGEVYHPCKPL